MLAYDVFSDNAFQATELREVVDDIVFIPQAIAQMGLFEVEPLATDTVTLYKTNETLEFVPTTERGSPRSLPGKDRKFLRQLPTFSIRQEDRINAAEIRNLVNETIPFATALANAEEEVDKRLAKLMRKLEYTREYHRFQAMAGVLLDADGTTLIDMFAEFSISKPAAVTFDFANLDKGALRTRVTNFIYRPMMRQLKGRKNPNTRIGALCSDSFFDKLLQNPEIYATYLIQQQAAELREQKAWTTINFAGVEWMNFQGTDDNTTIAIPDGRCRFFPINATDVFKEYRAPGDEWNAVNQLAQEYYAYVIPDVRAPVYMDHVDLYLDSHFLFACIAPDVLMEGLAL